MPKVRTGLDRIDQDPSLLSAYKDAKLGLLCHSASISSQFNHAIEVFMQKFPGQLKKLFGPQHGIVSDVQDNMIESDHSIHPHFKIPVYSLYSETRSPTSEMLEGLDVLFVDLQDVGTRIYTYIYTLTLTMEACAKSGVQVVILDRPNPIGGDIIEGNLLDLNFASFVGRHRLPTRHGLTIGEVGLMAKKYWNIDCDLEVISMKNWLRSMDFEQTQLPWVLPSPNLPTIDGCYTFVGTVLFEGTNISEGRGTTRSLEIVGHPKIEPFAFKNTILKKYPDSLYAGLALRPLYFLPTFQKHQGTSCGGLQIHLTDRKKARPWKLGQVLCKEFYQQLGDDFSWKCPPYEYEFNKMPIDLINGSDQLRYWVENDGPLEQLDQMAAQGREDYLQQRQEILLY